MSKNRPLTCATLAFALLFQACASTTTTTTTYTAPAPAWSRPGQVEAVREIVHRTQGNPVGGALAGAFVGGLLLGGRHRPSLFGAAAGAAVGASMSAGAAESRTYEVIVRFEDGSAGTFVYANSSPFGPGQPVVLLPQGLYAR